MIADRNMLDLEAVLLVVRRKVRPEVDVELQMLVGEQADDRAGAAGLGVGDPGVDDAFRQGPIAAGRIAGSWRAGETILDGVADHRCTGSDSGLRRPDLMEIS
jgi:hypothetical protein